MTVGWSGVNTRSREGFNCKCASELKKPARVATGEHIGHGGFRDPPGWGTRGKKVRPIPGSSSSHSSSPDEKKGVYLLPSSTLKRLKKEDRKQKWGSKKLFRGKEKSDKKGDKERKKLNSLKE